VAKKRKKHFLITAGGTREYIDPVRFISNASSGKMGYALAAAAQAAGHNVTLISTSDMQPPVGVEFVGVDTAAEMFDAVKKHFPKCDCLIMAAAVADYTPANVHKTKIKKFDRLLTLKLKPTKDILTWAGKHKNQRRLSGEASAKTEATSDGPRFIVGFALEDKYLRANAEKKLTTKKLDMIIANTPESLAADMIAVQIKTPSDRWLKLPPASKKNLARRIIHLIDKAVLNKR
jgi:phosphopantothenoylcysteine decarboxylase/phosphopantothenate--cysteine ligase